MKIVENNGGLRNTLAMESYDKGYSDCTASERASINERIARSLQCPQCGDAATYQTPDGAYWDSNAHHWRLLDVLGDAVQEQP